MDQTTETLYQFNADEYLKSIDSELHFYERLEIPLDEDHFEIGWEKISVGKVWVTKGPKNCQIHADIQSLTLGEDVTKEITPEQYRRFLDYKGEKRRLNMFLEVWKDLIWMKREKATRHVDLRVTPDLYEELCKGAKASKKTLSDYCRDILKGKVPKAALSDEETKLVMELVALRSDTAHLRNAMAGHLAGMSKEKRLALLIEGKSFAWWRDYIKKSLIILLNFSNKLG